MAIFSHEKAGSGVVVDMGKDEALSSKSPVYWVIIYNSYTQLTERYTISAFLCSKIKKGQEIRFNYKWGTILSVKDEIKEGDLEFEAISV